MGIFYFGVRWPPFVVVADTYRSGAGLTTHWWLKQVAGGFYLVETRAWNVDKISSKWLSLGLSTFYPSCC